MPNIDPKVAFWLGLALVVLQVIATGGVAFLHNAIPDSAIPYIVQWCQIGSTIGTAVMTYIAGSNMTQTGRLANVQAVPAQVRAEDLADDKAVLHVALKSQADANAVPSDKVIGPADLKGAP